GVVQGFNMLWEQIPGHFNMILEKGHPSYKDLPGLSVLLGGLWIAHFAYWGFNQYITQRALAAENIGEAQKGVMFAAYLKLVIPFIVVVPGIAAAIIFPTLNKPDEAYPAMMSLLPSGLLGLTFAALIAAIVSSLSSMSNSISTIFTMDIYKNFSNKDHSQKELVTVGRIASFTAMLIAVIAAKPLLGSLDEVFQYIQEYTGYFTPGILLIFLMALFWKKATSMAALVAAVGSFALSVCIAKFYPELPWMDRMGIVFIASALMAVVVVMLQGFKDHPKAVDLKAMNFKTSRVFNINTMVICLVLIVFYKTWW
ncbi:MAG: sodium transporter, partial [Gammaproteobacteria bacterium]|nr:sodium transporter [Gammaproteobacteria bacterium]